MTEITKTIEGLAEGLTPIAYKAAQNMLDATNAVNAGDVDLVAIVAHLEGQNRHLLHAIAQLEVRVRVLAGEVTEA